MKKCSECNGNMKKMSGKTPDGIAYDYFRCEKCGEEILNMDQLHEVANKYRALKRYHAKVSKWGQSLGLRIPKDLVKKYDFKNDEDVTLIPEKDGIRILPA